MMKNGTWGKWTSWGGVLTSSPAISGTAGGRIDVFARGTDNAVWTRTLPPGGVLTRWRSIGGRPISPESSALLSHSQVS